MQSARLLNYIASKLSSQGLCRTLGQTAMLHTNDSSLVMGRVASERYKKVVKVGVPKHRLNEYYLLYIREQENVQAYDKDDLAQPGDWVMLRKQDKPIDDNVTHIVESVVHSYGTYVDPLTGRRTYGLMYDDDLERLEKIKVDIKLPS